MGFEMATKSGGWTAGEWMFYGGIALAAFSLVMVFVLTGVFAAKKRKTIKKLEQQY